MAQAGINVTVDHSPPQKLPDGGWQINVWAIAQQRGRDRPPAPGERIEFFVDGVKQWESETENDGRTPTEVVTVPPEKDAVAIEGQPAGDAIRRSKKIVKREEKTKKPKDIRYLRGREGNEHVVVLTVLDEDSAPLKGEIVSIEDHTTMPFVVDLPPTNERGRIEFRLTFTGRRKDLVAVARGVRQPIPLFQKETGV